jgi:hypothetical protein
MSDDDHENPHGDIRFRYMYDGVVVDNADPLELGRVRFRIPGIIDDRSAWARPAGTGNGGTKKRGFKFVPPIGAEVVAYFQEGNPDVPRYLGGHWGTGEMPTDAAAATGKNPEQVHCIETDTYQITIDERTDTRALRLRDKVSGDMIEFDGSPKTGPGITIQASAALVLKVDGMVIIESTSCSINGRKVTDGSQNI